MLRFFWAVFPFSAFQKLANAIACSKENFLQKIRKYIPNKTKEALFNGVLVQAPKVFQDTVQPWPAYFTSIFSHYYFWTIALAASVGNLIYFIKIVRLIHTSCLYNHQLLSNRSKITTYDPFSLKEGLSIWNTACLIYRCTLIFAISPVPSDRTCFTQHNAWRNIYCQTQWGKSISSRWCRHVVIYTYKDENKSQDLVVEHDSTR